MSDHNNNLDDRIGNDIPPVVDQNKPLLLPYHEYIAMQKRNSASQVPSGVSSLIPTVNTSNMSDIRGYPQPLQQPYYSSNRTNYSSPYFTTPVQQPQTPSYTLPPYNQYQSYNSSTQQQQQQQPQMYYNYQQPLQPLQPLQPYSYYYNNNNMQQQQQSLIGPYVNNSIPQPGNIINGQQVINSYSSQQKVNQAVISNSNISSSNTKSKQQPTLNNTQNKGNSSSQQQRSPYKHQSHSNYTKNNNYQPKHQQDNNPNNLSSNDGWSQQQQQEQMIYQRYQSQKNSYQSNKNKIITKKKDTVLDDPEQVRKWIEARKRNYPGLRKKLLQQQNKNKPIQQETQQNQMNAAQKQQMSKLQSKIRKKLLIVNGDSRSIMKKIKNIDILRRIITDPKILKRERRNYNKQYESYNNNNNASKVSENVVEKVVHEEKQIEVVVAQQLPSQVAVVNVHQEQGQMVEEVIIDQQVEVENILQQKELLKQNLLSSQSQESIEPQQVPANKIPRHEDMPLFIQVETQKQQPLIVQSNIHIQQQQQKQPILFEIVDKKQTKPIQYIRQQRQPFRRQNKPLDPQMIIAHLKQKQQQDKLSLNTLFDYKSNSHSYNYRVQTLQTSLKLDQIFAQTTYLLQAVRYIVKNNFFDQ